MIFEKVSGDYFFELILSENDFDQIQTLGGIIGDFAWEENEAKYLNVYLRKEELCHLLKEKKPAAKKVSLKMSAQKCTPESHKSKLLLSLTPKRVGVRKKLLKREKIND